MQITKGSLVRYLGDKKPLWYGKLVTVHERVGDKVVVWAERRADGKYTKMTVDVKDVDGVV